MYISISKNKKYLLTASRDCTAKVIDISSKIVIKTFTGHTDYIHCAIFGNNNDVFTASDDRTIKRWNILSDDNRSNDNMSNDNRSNDNRSNDIISNECIHTYSGHKKCVKCVILDEINNRIFSSSYDTKIICWNVETGEKLGVMSGHNRDVDYICFVNPNTIASASFDTTIKLWNTTTFECIKTLKSHTDWVRSVVTAPDKLHIISGGDDCTVKIWDIRTGACLDTLKYHSSYVYKVAISSNGKHIASCASGDQLVITTVYPPFAYIVYTNDNTTLLSDGILRNDISGEIICQIASNDIMTIVNDYSFQICNKTFTTNTRELQAWIEYLKAIQLQLALAVYERDNKCNIINRYRFDIFQTIQIAHKSPIYITKSVMEIIGNYIF